MAVTIKSPPRLERRVECGHCGSSLAYLPSDVREWRHEDDTPADAYKYVSCPHCKGRAKIPKPRLWDDFDI
jgi:hypothetical protein